MTSQVFSGNLHFTSYDTIRYVWTGFPEMNCCSDEEVGSKSIAQVFEVAVTSLARTCGIDLLPVYLVIAVITVLAFAFVQKRYTGSYFRVYNFTLLIWLIYFDMS